MTFPGPFELVAILLIVLLIFGAGKLPAIGDALGRSIKNFKRGASGRDELEVAKKREIASKKTKPAELDEADDEQDVQDAEVVSSKAE